MRPRKIRLMTLRSLLREVAVFVTLISGIAAPAIGQCGRTSSPLPPFELVSPPFAQFPVRLRLFDFYASGAGIGDVVATVSGNQVMLQQQTAVLSTLPTLTCREQVVDLGVLPPGRYTVTWTTTEREPLLGWTRTRVLAYAFALAPAEAVPTLQEFAFAILMTGLVVAGFRQLAS